MVRMTGPSKHPRRHGYAGQCEAGPSWGQALPACHVMQLANRRHRLSTVRGPFEVDRPEAECKAVSLRRLILV
jgi:hypothetical protein